MTEVHHPVAIRRKKSPWMFMPIMLKHFEDRIMRRMLTAIEMHDCNVMRTVQDLKRALNKNGILKKPKMLW